MYRIHFVRQDVTYETEGGLLSQVCADAGYPLNLVCGGHGTCGKCRVEVLRDGVRGSMLACREMVESDLEVWLTDEQVSRSASIMTEGSTGHRVVLTPSVSKDCHSKQDLLPEHCGAYLSGCSIPVLRRFSTLAADASVSEITFVRSGDAVLTVEPGNTTGRLFGAAVDIGTTTVALYAYDLTTGKLLATESALNGQIARGADVISRILHTLQTPDGVEELNHYVLETINGLLHTVEEQAPGFCKDLYHVVLCGNSTMQHLFLGLHPSGLSVDPFVNVTADMVRCSGAESGLDMAPAGVTEFLPLLGGFVGADTAAVLLTLPEEAENCLMIDLGTNGEIAVGGHGTYKVASTACGPALEGGNIACGMRGTTGAIEKVSLQDGQVRIKVIGDVEAQGLCGSAIIDAVAELLRAGIVDESGRMLTAEEYAEIHPDSPLLPRLRNLDEFDPAFFFTEGEHPVYVSQKDIRQIQLAKSSIHSGCVTLLAENGLEPGDVTTLYLAGAFGNYIDIDNALYIGLLPAVPRERIRSIGNGAGQGVRLGLLDRSHLERCRRLPEHVEHLELATSPRFMEEYIMNMNFWI